MTDKIVVLSTCANAEEAERIGRLLLEQHLAACVTVLPEIRSIYRWKGALESAGECMLLIKTARSHFQSLSAALRQAHSYELPELLAIPVLDGSPEYLEWLGKNLEAE